MMLHKMFEEGDWFLPKRYGYGAGWPVTWQGYVLVFAYSLTVIGTALAIVDVEAEIRWAGGAFLLILTALFAVIVHRRTRGGWQWRWGGD